MGYRSMSIIIEPALGHDLPYIILRQLFLGDVDIKLAQYLELRITKNRFLDPLISGSAPYINHTLIHKAHIIQLSHPGTSQPFTLSDRERFSTRVDGRQVA